MPTSNAGAFLKQFGQQNDALPYTINDSYGSQQELDAYSVTSEFTALTSEPRRLALYLDVVMVKTAG